MIALRFLNVDDVDADEVACIVANLIFQVIPLSSFHRFPIHIHSLGQNQRLHFPPAPKVGHQQAEPFPRLVICVGYCCDMIVFLHPSIYYLIRRKVCIVSYNFIDTKTFEILLLSTLVAGHKQMIILKGETAKGERERFNRTNQRITMVRAEKQT